jgi:methionyl-tRNA synthetase
MENITFDTFMQLDLRVATVVAVERVEKSDKLVKLQLNVGDEVGERQIIAGIGKAYEPEVLVGTQIIIVANLEPRKLMGLESQGMLLAAHGPKGEPILLRPDTETPKGSKIN